MRRLRVRVAGCVGTLPGPGGGLGPRLCVESRLAPPEAEHCCALVSTVVCRRLAHAYRLQPSSTVLATFYYVLN